MTDWTYPDVAGLREAAQGRLPADPELEEAHREGGVAAVLQLWLPALIRATAGHVRRSRVSRHRHVEGTHQSVPAFALGAATEKVAKAVKRWERRELSKPPPERKALASYLWKAMDHGWADARREEDQEHRLMPWGPGGIGLAMDANDAPDAGHSTRELVLALRHHFPKATEAERRTIRAALEEPGTAKGRLVFAQIAVREGVTEAAIRKRFRTLVRRLNGE